MTRSLLLSGLALLPSLIAAQQIGTIPEKHPKLPTQICTKKHGCKTQDTYVVIDALSHPIDTKTGASCQNSTGRPDPAVCATESSCAKNCALEGINYAQHGVQTHGNAMTLHQYLDINGTETSVSPRLYLLGENGKEYEQPALLNQEFTFTVDVSGLPCGMNGALYLSAMDKTGGRSRLNPAGAAYGTGYCDAQCPNNAWTNGVANLDGKGACCNEMDIWEANARSTQLTPHACNITGLYQCEGTDCGKNGVCDEIGCGINPYGQGAHGFYGYGDVVDTTQPFTVVTQFHTDNGKKSGDLNQIVRFYIQNGKKILEPNSTVAGQTLNSITVSSACFRWCPLRGRCVLTV
jgi:cellulase